MHFYNLTLERATGINHAVSGDFIGNGKQQVVACSGKSLTLWKLKAKRKVVKMKKLLNVDAFGCIRSMSTFRPVFECRDYLIIGSDSGNIVILRYSKSCKAFKKVLQKIVGSSGCGRVTLGQYLAVDCKARAVMIGALENVKHVYVFSERSSSEYHLELSNTTYNASTEQSLIYDIVAVDDDDPHNTLFACLEAKYQDIFPDQELEIPKQIIVFYQLNTSFKSIDCIPLTDLTDRGNFLISVPDDRGVLLCASNCVVYYKMNHPVIRCSIPRRLNEVTKGPVILVCATTCKLKDTFFFLVQTEQGDIFRITLEKEGDMVNEIQLKYFTTVHVASALCFLNSGYLFVAAEFGNHFLYEIIRLEDDGPEFSSSVCLDQDDTFFFLPVALKNLVVVKEVQSLSPILQLEMLYPNQENVHLLVACGRGQSSTLRILQKQSKNYKIDSEIFTETSKQIQRSLENTPRKFIHLPLSSNIIIIEADHNAYTSKTKELKKEEILKEVTIAAGKYNKLFKDTETLHLALSALVWKHPGENTSNIYQCESGMWASAITVLDLHARKESERINFTTSQIYKEEFEQNEAACSLSLVKFASQRDAQYLLVGVVNKLELGYNLAQSGRIYTYKILNSTLEFVHKTVVEDCPSAICPFHGCVLIAVGSALRIYDFSEVMLFVKYEIPNLCNRIVSIHNIMEDNHIYVGDGKNGLFYLYKNKDVGEEEALDIFAEDIDPSWITTACLWGTDKLARADKFGNIFIVRLPTDSTSEKSRIPSGIQENLPKKYPSKVDMLATFHVGEIVCSLKIGDFSSHRSSEVLVYATLSGSIGILAPIEENDVQLLHFEMLMRVITPPLCGGDHLSFRSSYYPLLNVIDGDFLEQFYSLSYEQQEIIKNNIRTSPSEMLEKLRFKYLG